MTAFEDIKARAEGHTRGPWEARTTGRSGGDHWYICDDGESIAHIGSNDGENEDQRQPNAELMAAAPKLLSALEALEAFHVPAWQANYGGGREMCRHDTHDWPCQTVRAITEALQ